MKRIWILALGLCLSLGLNAGLIYMTLSRPAAPAPRAAPPRRQEGGPEGPPGDDSAIQDQLERLTRDLGLNPEQHDGIAALHARFLPQIAAERTRMTDLRRQVSSLYMQQAIDSLRFRSVVRQLSVGQARIDSLVTDVILGEAALLTFDQRERYAREVPWGHPLAPRENEAGQQRSPEDRKPPPAAEQRQFPPPPPRNEGQPQAPPVPADERKPPPRNGQHPPPPRR